MENIFKNKIIADKIAIIIDTPHSPLSHYKLRKAQLDSLFINGRKHSMKLCLQVLVLYNNYYKENNRLEDLFNCNLIRDYDDMEGENGQWKIIYSDDDVYRKLNKEE